MFKNRKTALVLMFLLGLMVGQIEMITYITLLGVGYIEAKLNQPSGDCLDLPFSVDKADGSISCEVTIPRGHSYALRLGFAWPKGNIPERKRIDKLLKSKIVSYDKSTPVNSPLELHVTIREAKDGGSVVRDATFKPVIGGGSADYVYAVISSERLQKGKYKITIKNLRAQPELKEIPIRFYFQQ